MTKKMLCPFCKEEINENMDTCPYCAEELQGKQNEESTEIIDESVAQALTINRRVANQFKNHLDFLWFEVEDLSESKKDGRVLIIWKHEKRSNLIVHVIGEDSVLISSRYRLKKVSTPEKLVQIYEALNKTNSAVLLTRWAYSEDDEDSLIVIETFLRGYNKAITWKNLDLMESEIGSYIWLFQEEN